MSKRHASEALDEMQGVDSPASKRSRFDDGQSATSRASTPAVNGNGVRRDTGRRRVRDISAQSQESEDGDDEQDTEEDGTNSPDDSPPIPARIPRQTAPTEGYTDLYLDTINRRILDFDFEKLCSVSLSNINVYACLVCGRYFQGRGPATHAYRHALDEDHHVFIALETQRVYVLPEGYEVKSRALDDIRYVSDPRYTRDEVARLDRAVGDGAKGTTAWDLEGRAYTPGFVGINNIKQNDYLNVVLQALAHTQPLRNFFLVEDFSPASGKKTTALSELVRRTATLVRKMWNPRAFKAHVSPHELLQEISLRSNKRFNLTQQSDPVDFLSWFLNNLHLGLGGSKTRPGTSLIHSIFQGRVKIESQEITARADAQDRLRFEESTDVSVTTAPFVLLALDLPPPPLFQDEAQRNIIPQVPLSAILSKYDGRHAQEALSQRRRYRLLHPLPPYLLLHVKRFSSNKFVSERNPTIVTFDPTALDMTSYVEPDPKKHDPHEPVLYDLVANVVHEAVRRTNDDVVDSGEERKSWKAQVLNRATGEWVVAQDLWVEGVRREMLDLGESYLMVWERRRGKKRG